MMKLIDTITEIEYDEAGFIIGLKGTCKAGDLQRGGRT